MQKFKISKHPGISIEKKRFDTESNNCLDKPVNINYTEVINSESDDLSKISGVKIDIPEQPCLTPPRTSAIPVSISPIDNIHYSSLNGHVPNNLQFDIQSIPNNVSIYINIDIYVNQQSMFLDNGFKGNMPEIQPVFDLVSPVNTQMSFDIDMQITNGNRVLEVENHDMNWFLNKRNNEEVNLSPNTSYNANYRKKILEPKKKCKCLKRRTFEQQQRYHKLMQKKIQRTRNFWNKSSNGYPFCFRKRVMNYYVDAHDMSVNEILDFSKKILCIDDFDSQSFNDSD